MSIDVPVTLRLLSHELRTPVGVIQGYLKMLVDGRVDDQTRPKVIAQLQQAASRVAVLSQQASDLSHWVSGAAARNHQDVAVVRLVEEIAQRVPGTVQLSRAVAPECAAMILPASDLPALVEAGLALVTAMTRTRAAVALVVRPARESGVDIAVTTPDARLDPSLTMRPIDLDESGVGLSLLLAAAMVESHRGRLWQIVNPPAWGMTLPGSSES
jgi:signal transduction histidine kinase